MSENGKGSDILYVASVDESTLLNIFIENMRTIEVSEELFMELVKNNPTFIKDGKIIITQ